MADRRGAGDGGIYLLANGRWQGAVDLGYINGRRVRKRITRPTRKEVVADLRQLQRQAEGGQLHANKPPTLSAWLDLYFVEVAAARVRPMTLAGYESLASLHIRPALGSYRIDRLRPQDITLFYRDRLTSLSPASVRRIHALLRRALNVAVRWQLIPANPASMVDPPPLTQREIQPFTIAEARAFLDAVADHRLYARWVVGLSLGLRQGETLGLQWGDIDLDAGILQVQRSLGRQPDGTLALMPTKTARSDRSIPMPAPLVAALRSHRERQQDERSRLGDAATASHFVFTTGMGTPIHPRNDYRAFQQLLKRSGLRKVRLHDLRHTAASLLLAQGVPARVVMEILGHSQISVTLNTYTHVDTTLTRTAAERMEEALWPTPPD